MDKNIIIGVLVLVIALLLWKGMSCDVERISDPRYEAWTKCALEFHEGLGELDQKHGQSPDYRAFFADRSELMNKRVACENAAQRL